MNAVPSLPIDDILPALRRALDQYPAVVLQAPPGAGKSTRVPLALLDATWLGGKKIVMLEPRRLAARNVARHMANQRSEKVGQTVGYQIRFERQITHLTRIEIITEGILTRRLQQDPELADTGLLIFDEYHERHLDSDLALALAREAQAALRPDLRLLIMSATLEAEALSRLLDNAPILSSQGRSHPIQIRHLPVDTQMPIPEAMARGILRAMDEQQGDILAFLPGIGEIRRTHAQLQTRLDKQDILIAPLYGDLNQQEQQRALEPGPRRRIVLATNIAETSLTIEGVTIVVDSGWARQPVFDPKSGMTRLQTQRISKASADQRAGRAGRLAPGVCYRLWSEDTHQGLLAQTVPEIRKADLASLLLELKQWGIQDPQRLSWLDPPPSAALGQASALLHDLDALHDHGALSPLGKRMAQLPVHPRLARMLLLGQDTGWLDAACDLAALLSERDIAERQDNMDLHDRLEALQAWRARGTAAAQAWNLDEAACRTVDKTARDLSRHLQNTPALDKTAATPPPDTVGLLLAIAYPDRIAQRREAGSARYRLANGRGAVLRFARHEPPAFLVAALLDGGQKEAQIQLSQALSLDALRQYFASHLRKEPHYHWNAQTEQVEAHITEYYGELPLSNRPIDKPERDAITAVLLNALADAGLDRLDWSPEARQLQARITFLRALQPDIALPPSDHDSLSSNLDAWLAPYLGKASGFKALRQLDLHEILLQRLSWPQRQVLDTGAPTHITVPSGSRIRLDYSAEHTPVLAVKLQEMFGLADTPRIAWGSVPVTLHLLSPAMRPIQVTQDLKGFWERTYAEVRKELKGRYPKHPWPDNPWDATPTRRTKRAGIQE